MSRLESKQQALIYGHAVPVPVVVRTREYGPKFYGELDLEKVGRGTSVEKDIDDLWG